jgi:hypothetical protein
VACALAAVLALATQPARAEDDAYAVNDAGHRYRVRFDPASRVTLGIAAASVRGEGGKPLVSPEIQASIAYRATSENGTGKDRVAWQIDQRFLAGWAQPSARAAGLPAFDASLYAVSMLRHDESPNMVLPTSPPIGVPFPFDVGFEAECGRAAVQPYAPAASGEKLVRVGVAQAAVLLDPWRSGLPGRSFSVGIGARYDLDALVAARTTVIHRVAPMTAGSLRFRFQTRDGLAVIDARGDAIPHVTSEGRWRFMARASLRAERTIVAIADQPIAAVIDGGYRLDPATGPAPVAHDFRASVGLAFNLQLR